VTYNPQIHHRRSIRLQTYDYSREGAYFLTICIHDRLEMFGEIKNGKMCVDVRGEIVQAIWYTLPNRFPGIDIDHFVVMPNHIHGILIRTDLVVPNREESSSSTTTNSLQQYRSSPKRFQSLKEIARTFKAAISHSIRTSSTPEFAWERNYHEHIIRNEAELLSIREYIVNNPRKWQEDELYPQKGRA